jgi:hypothetical protein
LKRFLFALCFLLLYPTSSFAVDVCTNPFVYRLVKGSQLTYAEGDANLNNSDEACSYIETIDTLFAPISHTHTSADITNFLAAVDAIGDARYAALVHNHSQYLDKNGIAGGQTANGGTTIADKLRLNATTAETYPLFEMGGSAANDPIGGTTHSYINGRGNIAFFSLDGYSSIFSNNSITGLTGWNGDVNNSGSAVYTWPDGTLQLLFASSNAGDSKSIISDTTTGNVQYDGSDLLNQARGDARYSLLGHTHVAANITDFTSVTQGIGDARYSLLGHAHSASDITSGTKTSAFISDFTTASQAVGDARYSLLGHTHTPSQVGLSNVTNDVQTKASIVPNTTPTAAQILAGNAGGTAYAPVSISQDCTMTSAGVMTCLKTNNVSFGTAATKNVPVSGDAASGEVVKGDDTRLNDARTPTSHTHPYTDINNITTSRLLGRTTAATGAAELITVGSGLNLAGGTLSATGGGSGTVTSVDVTLPSFLLVSGNPVTTSGTFAITLATQVANTIFAGPTTGADAAPTFRAMVTADIPNNGVTDAKASDALTITGTVVSPSQLILPNSTTPTPTTEADTQWDSDDDCLVVGDGASSRRLCPGTGLTEFVRVTKSATQNVNDSTETAVSWDQETTDTNGYHDNVTNNTRLTVPAGHGGTYVMACVTIYPNNATGIRETKIRLNGSGSGSATNIGNSNIPAGGSNNIGPPAIAMYILSAGDYVECDAYQTSTTTLAIVATNTSSVTAGTYFAMYRVDISAASLAITGGAGIDNTAGTISTASGETDFLASGALTCGAATAGRAKVHTTPLQYCDNAATPALQYAAYGNSTGESTATATGAVDVGDITSQNCTFRCRQCYCGIRCTNFYNNRRCTRLSNCRNTFFCESFW